MSKVRENRLWGWLKKAKPDFKALLCLDRVENSCMAGMADVNGKLKGFSEFWIELKTEAAPSNASTKVKPKFQPGQPEWHRKRAKAGSKTFILLQVGSHSKARRYLTPGTYAPKMAQGLTEKQLEEIAIIPPVCFASEIIEAAAHYDPL